MRRPLALLLSALVLGGCDRGGEGEGVEPAAPRGDGRVGPHEIGATGLTGHLRALQRIADRHGGDRATGTPGERATIAYVARRLREAGWSVRLEPVPLPFFDERSPALVRVAGVRRLREGEDFRTMTYSGSGRAEGRLHRIGRACARVDLGTLDPGDVAVAIRGGCFFRVKARNAESAGAGALLVVDSRGSDEPPSSTLGSPGIGIPVLAVSGEAGTALGRGFARVAVDAISERRRTHNVIAESAGRDGRRVVMAGAHLDSVPAGPGINDDGSGVAALLELADALGGRAPGARVRLAFWAAEEVGLVGSRRHVGALDRAERERIAAYLNLDMIGSPRPERAVYSDGDPRLERLLRRLVGPRATRERAGRASDHAPFQRAGIPVGGLFTGAGRPHDPCYHRRCDTLDNVDPKVLVQMARAAAEAVERLSAHG